MLLFFSIRCSNEIINYVFKDTPIKCVDLEDTSGQLKLEGWLYLLFLFFIPFLMRRHHFLAIIVRRPHFMGSLRREGTILFGKLRRRLVEFFLFMYKTMLKVGWSFILWSML